MPATAGACRHVPGHSLDRAREHYRNVLETYPDDPETWALLGRVDKDAWIAAWRRPGKTPEQMREEAAYEDALLRAAIDSYAEGYRRNPSHYYSGINALTLMHLYRHLTGDDALRPGDGHHGGRGALRRRMRARRDATLLGAGDTGRSRGAGRHAGQRQGRLQGSHRQERQDWFALNSSRHNCSC